MKFVRTFPIVFSLVAIGSTAWAAQHDGHKPHHPAGTAAADRTLPAKQSPDMARMDSQMQAMQAMHDKMMAATTPEARNALMAEHMKTMKDGMGMMKSMGGKGMGKDTGGMSDPKAKPADMAQRQQMMEQRMDMMQGMMEMMVDRLPPSPAKP